MKGEGHGVRRSAVGSFVGLIFNLNVRYRTDTSGTAETLPASDDTTSSPARYSTITVVLVRQGRDFLVSSTYIKDHTLLVIVMKQAAKLIPVKRHYDLTLR
jgi:hypothetical protein